MGARILKNYEHEIIKKNTKFQSMMMGVETPMPPVAMSAAAPEGAPPRRFRDKIT